MTPAALRQAAELGVAAPIRHGVTPGTERIMLGPYATTLVWITPTRAGTPAAPRWIEVRQDAAGTLLRWTPSTDPAFYSYEVTRDGAAIAPEPMRGGIVDGHGWVRSRALCGADGHSVRYAQPTGDMGRVTSAEWTGGPAGRATTQPTCRCPPEPAAREQV